MSKSLFDYIKEMDEQSEAVYRFCLIGKFRPYHKAHNYVYEYLQDVINKYGINGKVYICTDLKDDENFTAEQQRTIIEKSIHSSDSIINYKSGYNIKALMSAVGGSENDILVAALGQKDLDDGYKSAMFNLPKDGIFSWKKINDVNHIPYLRPVNFVHKEFTAKGSDAVTAKERKGTGYALIIPTQTTNEFTISSSKIRQLIQEKEWDQIKYLMVNDDAFNYLKSIKE